MATLSHTLPLLSPSRGASPQPPSPQAASSYDKEEMTERLRPYQKVKVLSTSQFWKAFLARHTEANTLCVVKQMERSNLEQQKRLDMLKEATNLRRMMDHPNIARFQDVFLTSKGKVCIVMEHAAGGDLQQAIKSQHGRPLEEATIREWFVQICFALKHVHDRKVLHRDLQTRNILLMASGQVKVGGFDSRVAKHLEKNSDAIIFSKAKCMAGLFTPEVVHNRPYNFKSDVWSCGAILYEMVTLKPLLDADNMFMLASKVLDQEPDMDAKYSSELMSLCQRMLSKSDEMRPSMKDVLSSSFLYEDMSRVNKKYGLNQHLGELLVPPPPTPRGAVSNSPSRSTSQQPPTKLDDELVAMEGSATQPVEISIAGVELGADEMDEMEEDNAKLQVDNNEPNTKERIVAQPLAVVIAAVAADSQKTKEEANDEDEYTEEFYSDEFEEYSETEYDVDSPRASC